MTSPEHPRGDGQILVVAGTRPEAVKLAGVVRALGDRAVFAHTGQHYDDELWEAVRREVGLPEPAVRIQIGGTHRGIQVGTATAALTEYLLAHPMAAVVVQGDTNSTLAGALAANATGTFLVHVEAGLRSDDPSMPEESNRVLVDRVADLCCAPSEGNAARLRAEGIGEDRIAVTGNTLFDALVDLLPPAGQRRQTLDRYAVQPDRFALATLHRVGNLDDPRRLAALLDGLVALAGQTPVLFPIHPHTLASARAAGLEPALERLRLLPPLSPVEFLALEAEAGLLVSDSGGVQEEACFLRRPLIVLRSSTERPELLDGWCELLGDRPPASVLTAAWRASADWRARLAGRPLPYPEGGAGRRIGAELDARLGARALAGAAA